MIRERTLYDFNPLKCTETYFIVENMAYLDKCSMGTWKVELGQLGQAGCSTKLLWEGYIWL